MLVGRQDARRGGRYDLCGPAANKDVAGSSARKNNASGRPQPRASHIRRVDSPELVVCSVPADVVWLAEDMDLVLDLPADTLAKRKSVRLGAGPEFTRLSDTVGPMRSLVAWLTHVRPSLRGHQWSESQLPHIPMVGAVVCCAVVVALIFPNSLLGAVLIAAIFVLVGAGLVEANRPSLAPDRPRPTLADVVDPAPP
jgi:hypothetical protein